MLSICFQNLVQIAVNYFTSDKLYNIVYKYKFTINANEVYFN